MSRGIAVMNARIRELLPLFAVLLVLGAVGTVRAGDAAATPAPVPAAADNAAASSRKAVNVYGANACISGYVWREAFAGDYVCVTSAVRSQVAADNAAAPSHTWP